MIHFSSITENFIGLGGSDYVLCSVELGGDISFPPFVATAFRGFLLFD